MYVMDTDFIINFFNGEKENVNIVNQIVDSNSDIYTTSLNLYELIKGCYQSGNFDKNYNLIIELRKSVKILNFDDESSLIAGKIFYSLKKSGTPINESDILIASICLKNDFQLLTENKKHFNRIDGLKVQ